MSGIRTRRQFLNVAAASALPLALQAEETKPKAITVVVWDERQPEQKQVYSNFLGNQIADHLKTKPGLTVKSVGIDDPLKGLSPLVLRDAEVLIWWGHKRQAEITPEMAKPIIDRIREGTLSLIALHSAHWATPFVEAMNERTKADAERTLKADGRKVEITYAAPPRRYTLPKTTDRLTPYIELRKFPDGSEKATVYLPYCCFPAYRADGKPSQIRVLKPNHPIAKELPKEFELPQTEMYGEVFHIPEPDEVVFEERWASGDWFRSGMVWKLGKGRVFYFRPGHETYAVYKEAPALRVIENAVRWLASGDR
ncbi:ThuA domain-containing protein [Zavarzinella formosa]|uniref:ThuA domain-containing protein n=1 Tax=Zavarzinella formosa TaxID=360055 RepID=UPI0002F778FA|nr:ThuA domain-containing protein [Zavarzinella formosa]